MDRRVTPGRAEGCCRAASCSGRNARAARSGRSASAATLLAAGCGALMLSAIVGAGAQAADPDPWAVPAPPPESAYDGPLFVLSHAYPETPVAPPDPAPWRQAIGWGEIDGSNALAYVNALKDHIADDMKTLLFDYANWNGDAAGWYNQPWLATIREPIHGTYVGSTFTPEMFPVSQLKKTMTTHVLVYYDAVAAGSLRQVWRTSGLDPIPGIKAGGGQFPEGGIIVKPAFTTADGDSWAPVTGAYSWSIWAPPGDGSEGDPELQKVQLFQFDIIVKDTASAPKTGWVFSTLVYDNRVEGDDWAKMVPLGAMWGNDPDVISPADCNYLEPGDCPPLAETWINPEAPVYAKETLGWGGRLSGPNDGAVDITAVIRTKDGLKAYDGRYAMSSCMSCHGPAEFEMMSFLLPAPSTCTDDRCTPTFAKCEYGSCKEVPPGPDVDVVYYEAGSPEFMRWFQDRPGDEPMDRTQPDGTPVIALDYDMVYAFKALPQWYQQTGQPGSLNFTKGFKNYRGVEHESEVERDR